MPTSVVSPRNSRSKISYPAEVDGISGDLKVLRSNPLEGVKSVGSEFEDLHAHKEITKLKYEKIDL